MAGSYEHILDGWSLIENMGDASEAVEELMYLVESHIGKRKAREILESEYYPMCRGEKPENKHFKKTRKLMSI